MSRRLWQFKQFDFLWCTSNLDLLCLYGFFVVLGVLSLQEQTQTVELVNFLCHRFICHFSDKTWATIYQRRYSAIPKKEDGKKRFWEQSQLLDGMIFSPYDYISNAYHWCYMRTTEFYSIFKDKLAVCF